MRDVRDFLATQGAFVETGTPAQMTESVKGDMDKWREVVRIAGIRPD
jgi:tripartite-type tricarboxylate transporter receptor subunit TctC